MGYELPTETLGSGPDVVLVHGALGDRRQWGAVASALAGTYRTHAVSRRHHWPGPTPTPDERYTYELHRDDLLALLARFAAPVHLVGHSYGAGVAMLAALRSPQLVKSLTLIEPALGSLLPEAGVGLAEERASRAAGLAQVRALVDAGRIEVATETFVDWLQGVPGGFAALDGDSRQWLRDNAPTLGPTLIGSQPDVSPAHLRALRMPTLVINGGQTRAWYRLIGEVTAVSIPGATRATLPGCRHMTIVEAPSETAALLRPFLAR